MESVNEMKITNDTQRDTETESERVAKKYVYNIWERMAQIIKTSSHIIRYEIHITSTEWAKWIYECNG